MLTRSLFPHVHKKKYYNHPAEKPHGFFLDSLSMFFFSRLKRLFSKKLDLSSWTVVPFKSTNQKNPRLTWIGHSTFLIELEFGSIKILTDPIFGNASPLFKRILPPGLTINDINTVDYVLLSHNHRDHMDEKSLMQLKNSNTRFLVPRGDKNWFDRRKFTQVKEHTWWQSTVITHKGNPLIFTFLPAHHWSQRSLFDRNRSLWGSWMVQYDNSTIYFAGDTAYSSHFKNIKEKFPSIDLALMPIGPCQPHEAMKHSHMNTHQAGQAFIDLGARHFIPMHWGTFYFGTDSFSTAIDSLTDWWKNEPNVFSEQLHILKFGQSWELFNNNNNHKNILQTRENSLL